MTEEYFDGQRDNEDVIFIWRRHPWTLFKPALLVVLLSWVVAASLFLFGASPFTSLVIGGWLIVVPIVVGYVWFTWWNDLYLLTSVRLVDVDQRRLFHRVVSEVPLENVQDVTFETRGPIQTFLNFGVVNVQTSSVTTQISIEGVADPQSVQQAILRATQRLQRAHRGSTRVSQQASRLTEKETHVPEGTITFLFSDIVGSSKLWERFPEAMEQVIAQHDDMLKAIINDHGGVVFKTMGDSISAAFESPVDSLAAAAQFQRAIGKTKWKTFDPLLPAIKIRIGIHSGTAKVRGGDYFGPTVNRVARVASLGNANDILLSEATKTLVEDTLPAKARLLDRGKKKLKGLRRPEHLFQLSVDDLSDLKRVVSK